MLLPLIFFWWTGRLEPMMRPRVVAIFLLGALQGGVGWWMVASGLEDRTDVSQYRLATHLVLACIILAYVLWTARGLSPKSIPSRASLRLVALIIVGMTFLQIFLGGLVAGLDAGLIYNTWPLMDGALVPHGLFLQQPWWRNVFESVETVQFDHRIGAYTLWAMVVLHAWQCVSTGRPPPPGCSRYWSPPRPSSAYPRCYMPSRCPWRCCTSSAR